MINERVGTLENLENDGTYDILVTAFPSGYPEGRLTFNFTDTPRKITGIQKVAQVFMYALLTAKGVDPIKPNFGTGFFAYIKGSNNFLDLDLMYREVNAHIIDAEGQVKANINTGGADKASQLDSIQLMAVDPGEESLTVTIRINNMEGTSAALAIPFPQLDLGISDNG